MWAYYGCLVALEWKGPLYFRSLSGGVSQLCGDVALRITWIPSFARLASRSAQALPLLPGRLARKGESPTMDWI